MFPASIVFTTPVKRKNEINRKGGIRDEDLDKYETRHVGISKERVIVLTFLGCP